MTKFLFLAVSTIAIPFFCSAQLNKYKFTDGEKLTLSGRSRDVHSSYYHRIDSSQLKPLTKAVQHLASDAAGLNISFKSNSKSIAVKFRLGKYEQLKNMTPIAVNGVDLYGWNGRTWQYMAATAPASTSVTDSAVLISNLDGQMRDYKIYLPLYSELKSIAVGVEKDAVITPVDSNLLPDKKVVIYGSSITQGASASRPGLAYPSIISRKYNVETFNMGFSGNGKIEIEMADVIAKMPADLYVLDCVPNPTPEQIKARTIPFIHKLRSLRPDVPIIMVESIFRETANWDAKWHKTVIAQNANFTHAYEHQY